MLLIFTQVQTANDPLTALVQPNSKHECLRFAGLGSAVVANFSMMSDVDNANSPVKNKFGAYSLTDPNYT